MPNAESSIMIADGVAGTITATGGAVATASIVRHKADGIAAHALLHHVV